MKVAEKVENSIPEVIEIKEKRKSKRDISIELIRVFACITVICMHLSLHVLNQCYNRIDWSRLLEKSFLTDGVPLFFMITGFFIANGRSYKKIWKSTIKKVLLPALTYMIFAQVFYMFIVNKESFVWCLQNIFLNLNFGNIFQSIFTGDAIAVNSLCQHLWYIYSYIKIVIWIPILWLVCKEDKESKLARRIIMIFGTISMIIIDIQRFITLPFGEIKIFQLVDKEVLYVLLGYEMFVHKDKIKGNKKICIWSLIVFVILNFLRYKIEMQYMVINSFTDIVGRASFVEWRYSSLNIFTGILIFMFLYSFEIKEGKFSKIIEWISDKTFGIYLIHYLVIAKIDLYKFEKIEKIYFELAYLLIGLIVTAAISIAFIVIFRKVKELCGKVLVNNKHT